jgi:hypothetical protein
MNKANPIDIPRLIRIATLLGAVLAGSLVYFAYLPRVEALRFRIEDAETSLRSAEIAASEMPRLRAERDILATRYARVLSQNADAVFLRELVAAARRGGTALVTTSLSRSANASQDGSHSGLLMQTRGTVELRGAYRNVLVVIAELSSGADIVAVDPPSVRRDGRSVVASVPVTIYEPAPAAREAQ